MTGRQILMTKTDAMIHATQEASRVEAPDGARYPVTPTAAQATGGRASRQCSRSCSRRRPCRRRTARRGSYFQLQAQHSTTGVIYHLGRAICTSTASTTR